MTITYKSLLFGKLGNQLISLIYVMVFAFCYKNFLNFHYGYMGYTVLDERYSANYLFVSTTIIALLPCLLYRGIKQISSFLCVFIYFLLYVPIIITYHYALEGTILDLLYQQSLFMLGMIMLFSADRLVLKKMVGIKTQVNLFSVLLWITILTTIYILFIYRGNLRLVSFSEVYELRSENEKLGADVVTAYLGSWFTNVMIPICLGYALFAKKKLYYIVGSTGCLLVYMATGSKAIILLPVFIYLIYLVFRRLDLNKVFFYFGSMLVVLIFILTLLPVNMFSAVILMRTIGNGGDLTLHYHQFFQSHPLTYFSHINIINLFTGMYPYKGSLGQEVGGFYWGDAMNANANFWATDGYAAIGSLGILFSSLILMLIFIVFNGITKNYNRVFLIVILTSYLTQFLNASLFQSLFTGGALLIFLFLSFSSVRNIVFLKRI